MGVKKANSKHEGLIVCDPEILNGKPIVKGTRIAVELILEKLSCGESMEEILKSHPRLKIEDIYSALGYASKVLRSDIVDFIPECKYAVRS